MMRREGYHAYGWYLDGKRVAGCPPETTNVQVGREDLSRILAALEAADPCIVEKQEYRCLREALEGK